MNSDLPLQMSHCKYCGEEAQDCICKHGRLLSEQEMIVECDNNCTVRECTEGDCHAYRLAKAQLAKTDKEWVEWVKSNYESCISGDCLHDLSCIYRFLSPTCILWQARKKEIGL